MFARWKTFLVGIFTFATTTANAETIFVSNELDNTVTVVNGTSYQVERTIPVGKRPRGLALNGNKELMICASIDNRIEVLNLEKNIIVRHFSTPDPEMALVAQKQNRLYAVNENDNLVTVFEMATAKTLAKIPVGKEPEGIGISPNGKILAVSSETSNRVDFINTVSLKVFAHVDVDSRPRSAEFSPNGKTLWTSSELGGVVSVIDIDTFKIIKKIGFQIPNLDRDSIKPVGIKIARDAGVAFVALGRANLVAVIDTKNYQVLDYIPVGQRVWQLAFNASQDKLFTANGKSNDISVINVKTRKVIKTIPVGKQPWGIVVTN